MTWTKLSDDFGDDCAELSDAAFRTHVEGLLWTMRREGGGFINERDVRRFAESHDADLAVKELVHRGMWSAVEKLGYRIEHHMEHQPEPDVIAQRRDMAAERQRRKRRKAVNLDVDTQASQRDDPRDDPRDPGRDGAGRSGTGSNNEGGDLREPGGWRCKNCGINRRDMGMDFCRACVTVEVPTS